MTSPPGLRAVQRAAETAAARFAERGQIDEAAVSALMACRYRQQLNDKEN